jgi:thiamine-phosphate pyrophosphorylase
MSVAEARKIVGPDLLVGLSTHTPLEIDAAIPCTPDGSPYVDYIGVGPVHATPTKLGRPPVGPELVSYASAHAHVPFFAIGGIDTENVVSILDAGASRVCVLRAICDAHDPERAALTLRGALELRPLMNGHGRP